MQHKYTQKRLTSTLKNALQVHSKTPNKYIKTPYKYTKKRLTSTLKTHINTKKQDIQNRKTKMQHKYTQKRIKNTLQTQKNTLQVHHKQLTLAVGTDPSSLDRKAMEWTSSSSISSETLLPSCKNKKRG